MMLKRMESDKRVESIQLLCLTLPLPPSINQQYATVRGRRVLSAPSRAFKKTVATTLAHMQRSGTLSHATVAALQAQYLGLYISFYFETPLRRDLDGGLKITQDALCEALQLNDNRVVDVHLLKRLDPLHPRVVVELEPISEWQFDEEYVYLQPIDHPLPPTDI